MNTLDQTPEIFRDKVTLLERKTAVQTKLLRAMGRKVAVLIGWTSALSFLTLFLFAKVVWHF
jgi:hypothetical protein